MLDLKFNPQNVQFCVQNTDMTMLQETPEGIKPIEVVLCKETLSK